MRTRHAVLALVALTAVVSAAWLVPANLPADAAEEGGCEARGLGTVSCAFDCRAGEHLTLSVDVEWGWMLSKATGRATCGEDSVHCDVRGTACASVAAAAGGATGVQPGLGRCEARKTPFAFFPGVVRVSCGTMPA